MFDILSEGSDRTTEEMMKEMEEAATKLKQQPPTQILVISESFPVYGLWRINHDERISSAVAHPAGGEHRLSDSGSAGDEGENYMKRFLALLCAFTFCCTTMTLFHPMLTVVSAGRTILPIAAEKEKPDYEDDRLRSHFVGRLYIDSVGIDVALYHSMTQYVVDDSDSAAYFDLYPWKDHMVIADHSTQAFGALIDVEIGAIARIHKEDGTFVYYECIDVFDGYNKGGYISDINGKIVMHRADLLMYTCLDYYKGVRVVLWNEIEQQN